MAIGMRGNVKLEGFHDVATDLGADSVTRHSACAVFRHSRTGVTITVDFPVTDDHHLDGVTGLEVVQLLEMLSRYCGK